MQTHCAVVAIKNDLGIPLTEVRQGRDASIHAQAALDGATAKSVVSQRQPHKARQLTLWCCVSSDWPARACRPRSSPRESLAPLSVQDPPRLGKALCRRCFQYQSQSAPATFTCVQDRFEIFSEIAEIECRRMRKPPVHDAGVVRHGALDGPSVVATGKL
jgi:hypothetical protein